MKSDWHYSVKQWLTLEKTKIDNIFFKSFLGFLGNIDVLGFIVEKCFLDNWRTYFLKKLIVPLMCPHHFYFKLKLHLVFSSMTLPIKRTEGSGLDWPRFEYLILLILSLSNSCIYTANINRKTIRNTYLFQDKLLKIVALII